MKSKISCWRLVRSIDDAPRAGDEVRKRTLVRTLAGAPDGLKGGPRRGPPNGRDRGGLRRRAGRSLALCWPSPRACGGTGRRARLRALWTVWSVEGRILSGAFGESLQPQGFVRSLLGANRGLPGRPEGGPKGGPGLRQPTPPPLPA